MLLQKIGKDLTGHQACGDGGERTVRVWGIWGVGGIPFYKVRQRKRNSEIDIWFFSEAGTELDGFIFLFNPHNCRQRYTNIRFMKTRKWIQINQVAQGHTLPAWESTEPGTRTCLLIPDSWAMLFLCPHLSSGGQPCQCPNAPSTAKLGLLLPYSSPWTIKTKTASEWAE